jgi:hypothetical protein
MPFKKNVQVLIIPVALTLIIVNKRALAPQCKMQITNYQNTVLFSKNSDCAQIIFMFSHMKDHSKSKIENQKKIMRLQANNFCEFLIMSFPAQSRQNPRQLQRYN